MKNKKLKKFYNKVYLKGEEKHYTSFLTNGTPSEEFNEVLKEVNWKGKNIIDIGCGTGLFPYLVAKKGANVLGIDYSDEAIKIAKKRYNLPNLAYENIDVTKNMTGKYDVIVSIGTLEHMDKPYEMLKLFKRHLKNRGKIIITSPNWTNPRGYVLMALYHLFDAPITLADLHYLTPIDFQNWAKKLEMNLKWRTIDKSWAHGDVLIKDFKRRIPNVLSDAKLPTHPFKINRFLNWLGKNVLPFNNSLQHSGATGLYVFSKK